jgi:hypothetical protein
MTQDAARCLVCGVIVYGHREQARSHRGGVGGFFVSRFLFGQVCTVDLPTLLMLFLTGYACYTSLIDKPAGRWVGGGTPWASLI